MLCNVKTYRQKQKRPTVSEIQHCTFLNFPRELSLQVKLQSNYSQITVKLPSNYSQITTQLQ